MPPPPVDYTIVHAVPGYGKPLRIHNEGKPLYLGVEPLPNALAASSIENGCASLPLTTLREFTMMQFMNAITDKKDWQIKVHDDVIAERWKVEGIAAAKVAYEDGWDLGESDNEEEGGEESGDQANDGHGDEDGEDGQGLDSDDEDDEDDDGIRVRERWPVHYARRNESPMTAAMANYCIDELRYRADHFEGSPRGAIPVYNGIVKSDTAVSLEVKEALQKAVLSLEDVPPHLKDWHPGSDDKVLDLVHPSLFPLVYGSSRGIAIGSKVSTLEDSIQRIGEGATIPPPEEAITKAESNRFQWLPCEVDIMGEKAKIISYINNLHPQKHPELYGIIEEVITAALPLWEISLAHLSPSNPRKTYQRIQYTEVDYDPNLDDWYSDEYGPQEPDEEEEPDEGFEFDWSDMHERWMSETRRVVHPEPGDFDPIAYEPPVPFKIKERFVRLGHTGRPLQVIVKLANIELTPEKPDYEGGSWHVEGKINERIVASAIYYYSCSNITLSSLGFRQISSVDMGRDVSYEQNEDSWLYEIFGCTDTEAVQDIGSVDTIEGRLLTFFNLVQHQVQPFSLADPTKPGHRKILALFLVDPFCRIPSTAVVPPQQLSWWRGELELEGAVEGKAVKPVLDRLPLELQDHVYEEFEEDPEAFPISLARAKKLREELMDERKSFLAEHGRTFLSSQMFSLCEH